jgi:3-phenylpropionate/trans-cinnamate dioxygenase ferredoxin reductase subunit
MIIPHVPTDRLGSDWWHSSGLTAERALEARQRHGPNDIVEAVKRQSYDAVHWFWSDQYEDNLQYAGFHQASEQVVLRGDLGARNFVAFYLNQGHIDGVVALNRGKDIRRAMPLIKARVAVDPGRLGDEGVDLRSIADDSLSGART